MQGLSSHRRFYLQGSSGKVSSRTALNFLRLVTISSPLASQEKGMRCP